jgi:hypothetical protein
MSAHSTGVPDTAAVSRRVARRHHQARSARAVLILYWFCNRAALNSGSADASSTHRSRTG